VSQPYVTKEELTAWVRISLKTIDRLIARGEFPPAIFVSKHKRVWDRAAVQRFIDSRPSRLVK
jgi:predicted DNA-binding transcriptional regulator AlpA